MDRKSGAVLNLKDLDEAKGTFEAVFATFNVIDSDGDITEPGAFPDGKQVPVSSFGHTSWSGDLPVGIATISQDSKAARVKGKFFLDTTDGKDTFLVVKRMFDEGVPGEWSYGYDVLDADMAERDMGDGMGARRVRILKSVDVHEVSPVLLGAGVGTRTTGAKNRKGGPVAGAPTKTGTAGPIKGHTAYLTDRPWQGEAMLEGMAAKGLTVDGLRAVHAWVDTTADPTDVKSYRFPHHHGADGPANLRAVVESIAVLNGAMGGSDIPAGDRKAVYDHLAQHLREADREVPPLRDPGGTLTLYEEALTAVDAVSRYQKAAASVVALRAEKNKGLSKVNLLALDWVGEAITAMTAEHQALLDQLKKAPADLAAQEELRFIRSQLLAKGLLHTPEDTTP